MKKLSFTLLCLLVFTLGANAQKVTQKILEGKWMLTQLTMDGNVFDIKNNTVKLTPEYLAGYKKKTPEQVTASMVKHMNAEMKDNYFMFLGNVFEMKFLSDTVDTEKYIITESKGKYHITSPSDDFEVRVVGGTLYAEASSGDQKLMLVLEKQSP